MVVKRLWALMWVTSTESNPRLSIQIVLFEQVAAENDANRTEGKRKTKYPDQLEARDGLVRGSF